MTTGRWWSGRKGGGRREGGDLGVTAVLLRYELKMLVRDTRTVLIAVVAPVVLFPLLIWMGRAVEEREEQRLEEATYRYAVVGDRRAWAEELVERALALPVDSADRRYRFEAAEVAGGFDTARDVDARAAAGDSASARLAGSERTDSLLEAVDLDVLVRGLSPESRRAFARTESESRNTDSVDAPPGPTGEDLDPTPRVPAIVLDYRASSDRGRRASSVLEDRLTELRGSLRDSVYRVAGFPVEPDRVARVEPTNTASRQRETGALLGLGLTPVLLMLMLTGGSIVAADAISGEKERGTLETLLTTGAHRTDIVNAKLGAVVVVGLAVAVVNLVNLLVYVVVGVFDLPPDFAVDLSVLDLGLLFVLLAPVTVVVAGALLLLSGYAKSYREYQIYFFPLLLVFVVASLAATLPGMELRSAVAFVPVSGVGVAVREVMVGERDWLFLLVAFLSTGAAAWWLGRLTERALATEKLVSGAELDEAELLGGPALFPRRVLRWFAVLWAAFFVISLWFGESLGVRGQIAVNLVGLFFGGTLLMIRRYRLPVQSALALRAPPAAAWPAVLIGAPSAFVLAVGLAQLVNAYVFPVPEEVLESFAESLTGEGLPVWQTVLFLAVMPGLFEEIAFRGALLHGLRKRFHPVVLCLVVGAIFGLFHVSLFRIVSTAYLGVVLSAVVVLTGSIFPAMLWHALNNAVALVPSEMGWVDAEAALPLWSYPVAAVGLAVAFGLLWRYRRVYPGLAENRKSRIR